MYCGCCAKAVFGGGLDSIAVRVVENTSSILVVEASEGFNEFNESRSLAYDANKLKI
jgi:hypothetical protein